MDFFQTQNDKRRESLLLLVGFAAAFAVCFAIIYWLASAIAGWVPDDTQVFVKWGIISGFAGVITWGCYQRWQDVAGGGHTLAEHLGAERIHRRTDDRNQRRLLNMVEEISVAAGIKPPRAYVLPMEQSINAFVAGNRTSTVLVVTRGALTHFNEDEMRAVVAHEIAHIANDDLGISMKLLIGLGGLNAITEAGYSCYATTHIKSSDNKIVDMFSDNPSRRHGNPVAGFMLAIIVGTLLVLLGCVFTLLGDILKTAFSRKREFLADAKAVQYTRDTWAMASALQTISEHEELRGLRLRYQGAIDHMCIDAPGSHMFFDKWLATHPPLDTRIKSIDPHFDIKLRKRREREAGGNTDAAATNASGNKSAGAARTVIAPAAEPIVSALNIAHCGAELSILISLMIQTAGYNDESNLPKYESTLKCYTGEKHPMRNWQEPNITEEFESALDTLLKLPAIQRQNLLDHIGELVEHDGILLEEETRLLEHVYKRLNPSDKAA